MYRALLRPRPVVVERFRDQALAVLEPSYDVVAVHVRAGDNVMHGKEKLVITNTTWTDDKYWACAAKREAVRIQFTSEFLHGTVAVITNFT